MINPLISIIVPVYNVEQYLNECVQSLINQTYSNLEIILVDDGSTDGSSEKCDWWSSMDVRVKAFHLDNGGASRARNFGICISKGECLMFVDSDDYIEFNMVEKLLSLLLKTGADISCCEYYLKKDNLLIQNRSPIVDKDVKSFSGIDALRHMLNGSLDCSPWNRLYKRVAIGNLIFQEGRTNEDILFLFSLYKNCSQVVYIDECLYYYRQREGSVTKTMTYKKMHYLYNCLDMEQTVVKSDLPLREEMKNYKCRVCLELSYSIQKAGASNKFTKEYRYTRNYVQKSLLYMFFSEFYTWRDLLHAIIVVSGVRFVNSKSL